MQSGSLGSWFGGAGDPQIPYDVAVVTPSVLRPSLLRALASVFAQDLKGRIQVLVGVDAPTPAPAALLELLAQRPANVDVLMLTLPYSTSIRHGGVHRATDGGALRTILTFMANARHVAYLDDDNAFAGLDHQRVLGIEAPPVGGLGGEGEAERQGGGDGADHGGTIGQPADQGHAWAY